MYLDTTLSSDVRASVKKPLDITTEVILSTLRQHFSRQRPHNTLTDLGVICRAYVEYHKNWGRTTNMSYWVRRRLRGEYEYVREKGRLTEKSFLRTVYDRFCLEDDNDELEKVPKKPTREEIFRRIDMMNKSIESWDTRPYPPPLPMHIPQRKQFTYFAGRGRDHVEVFRVLEERFKTADKQEIFLQSFTLLCPVITPEACTMVIQALQDFKVGAPLPCFVLAAYCKSV